MRELLVVALLCCATSTFAGAFLKIGDVKGGSLDTDPKDWIVLDKFSLTPQPTFGCRAVRGRENCSAPSAAASVLSRLSSMMGRRAIRSRT